MNKVYPIIDLQFDEKLDQELAWEFYTHQEHGGCNFWLGRAIKYHPSLINIDSIKDKKKYLEDYVSEYYISHEAEIKSLSEKTAEYLKEKQEEYFLLADKIFKGYPWPKKEFTGCLSIFDFCPRFLKEGAFQVCIYDDRNEQLYTIFHECLHFIFYDFAQKNFPDTLGEMNTEKGKFWDIAEVFNVVMQSTDDFIALHGKRDSIGYPDHKELIAKGTLLWENDQNVYNWINEMIK